MDDFDFSDDELPEPPKPVHPSALCPHDGTITIINGGLRKCVECDSIEGLDKRWRNADALWPPQR